MERKLRLQWHSPVLNRTYSHVDSFPGSRVGRHKSDFFLSDERDIRPGQYLFSVHYFSSTKYALLSTQDDMAQVGLEPECYLRDCHFNQNMREKDLLPALNVHSVRIFKGVSKKLYDSATSSTKWIHYFLVVINVLLLLFFSRVFCEMILVRRLFLASPIFLIVLTIILGVIRKSSYSALVYFCSLFIIGFPFILLLALTVRIFIKRKTLELMHYDDPRRLLVLVQQMREVINQTQSSIHQLVETKRFSANQGNTFKYYCPICMLYFKSIMETTCCDQYICRDCVISFARSKGIIPEESVDLPESFPSTSCPYCTKTNFQVIVPSESEETKDYRDTPRQGKTRKDSPVLKIGDSFERMKAKMIKLESLAPLPDPEKSKSVTNSPVRDNCPLPPNTMSPAQLSSDHSLASEDQVREHQSSPVSVNRDNQEQQMHRVEHRTGILADGSLPRPPEQHADYDQMLPNTPSHSISVMRLGSLEFGPRNQ